jgi:hypothetical protein
MSDTQLVEGFELDWAGVVLLLALVLVGLVEDMM